VFAKAAVTLSMRPCGVTSGVDRKFPGIRGVFYRAARGIMSPAGGPRAAAWGPMESKLPGIQVGRAIAAASVFYFHSYIALGYFDQSKLKTVIWLAAHGASGVDLFFAISGFIVCYVASRPDFTPASFLWKRFFRIYPLNAAVTIAIVLICRRVQISDDVGFLHVLESILILPQHAPVNSVGWTLEYEIVFYLLAALLLPMGGPRALLGYCVLSYLLGIWIAPQTPIIARFVTEHHAAFGAGVLAYMIAVRFTAMSKSATWSIALGLPLVGLAVFEIGNHIAWSILTPIGCGLAVIGLALLPWAPKWIVKFGDISYGFYLFHWPVIGLAAWAAQGIVLPNPSIGELWRWQVFIYVWLLSHLSWVYLERPINRWARVQLDRLKSGATTYRASAEPAE
jgi:exopolysaccharide production protein ExoZ